MSTMAGVIAKASHLAAGQWGLLTTAQAEREGISRLQLARLANADILERVDRGIYATTASVDEHRELRAAWLALDPARTAEERLADPIIAGVVSHTSAAGLHRLGDLLDDQPEITFPHRKQTRRGIRLHQRPLTKSEVTFVSGLPVTSEERTVADLLGDGHDSEHVAHIIGQGARRGVIDIGDLADQLEPFARRNGQADGTALVEHLLDLVGLSPAALTRELSQSSVGKDLVSAGQFSGALETIASFSGFMGTAITEGRTPALALGQLISGHLKTEGLINFEGLARGVSAFQGIQKQFLESALGPDHATIISSNLLNIANMVNSLQGGPQSSDKSKSRSEGKTLDSTRKRN